MKEGPTRMSSLLSPRPRDMDGHAIRGSSQLMGSRREVRMQPERGRGSENGYEVVFGIACIDMR